MTDNRLCNSATRPSTRCPRASGPRWAIARLNAAITARSGGGPSGPATIPAIPHIRRRREQKSWDASRTNLDRVQASCLAELLTDIPIDRDNVTLARRARANPSHGNRMVPDLLTCKMSRSGHLMCRNGQSAGPEYRHLETGNGSKESRRDSGPHLERTRSIGSSTLNAKKTAWFSTESDFYPTPACGSIPSLVVDHSCAIVPIALP